MLSGGHTTIPHDVPHWEHTFAGVADVLSWERPEEPPEILALPLAERMLLKAMRLRIWTQVEKNCT
jgi:hypothetical protein